MSDLKKIFTNSLMVEISVNENTMEMLTKEKRKESILCRTFSGN